MSAKNVILAIHDLSRSYRMGKTSVSVLHDVNTHIDQGEMVAIMGPSGSGKSTLMHLIGLLDRPTSGSLELDGRAITLTMSDASLAAVRSQKIGFIFQSFNLLPKMSSLANVLVPTTYYRSAHINPIKRATELLKRVGLASRMNHKPSELSGGEKQRVAIARALVNDPEIILADEPTGNLDSRSGEEVMDLLAALHKEGKTIIVVTHDHAIAARCQRIIHMLDGTIKPSRETLV